MLQRLPAVQRPLCPQQSLRLCLDCRRYLLRDKQAYISLLTPVSFGTVPDPLPANFRAVSPVPLNTSRIRQVQLMHINTSIADHILYHS